MAFSRVIPRRESPLPGARRLPAARRDKRIFAEPCPDRQRMRLSAATLSTESCRPSRTAESSAATRCPAEWPAPRIVTLRSPRISWRDSIWSPPSPGQATSKPLFADISARALGRISYLTDIAARVRRIGPINAFRPEGAAGRISPASQRSNQLTSFFPANAAQGGNVPVKAYLAKAASSNPSR